MTAVESVKNEQSRSAGKVKMQEPGYWPNDKFQFWELTIYYIIDPDKQKGK